MSEENWLFGSYSQEYFFVSREIFSVKEQFTKTFENFIFLDSERKVSRLVWLELHCTSLKENYGRKIFEKKQFVPCLDLYRKFVDWCCQNCILRGQRNITNEKEEKRILFGDFEPNILSWCCQTAFYVSRETF